MYKPLEKIFSVKNKGKHKVITVSGVKIKLKRKNYKEPTTTISNTDPLYLSIPDILGKDALWKLLKEYKFNTVLDLGAGEGLHSKVFYENGKEVTAISAYDEKDFDVSLKNKINFVISDYLSWKPDKQFDCIWASHILEHQLNIGIFLRKIYNDLKDNGILAISVPPSEILAGGGHISCFTPGHLIYQLVMNGFDLSEMNLKVYGYNLSIICKKNLNFNFDNNNYTEPLSKFYKFLPDYVVESIECYKKEHPSPWGGHERIPDNITYKW